jgi:hypothetical protein
LDEIAYTFDGARDARIYLREIAVLWSVWVIGMIVILLTNGGTLILWSVAVMVVLMFLARPLLIRAEKLVPENKREGNTADVVLRGGTTRDRALRNLAYGSEPMRVALASAGLSERWLLARHLAIAVTILGLVLALAGQPL